MVSGVYSLFMRVVRIVLAITLALFLAQATGIAAFAQSDDCEENCPGDAPDGHCPPDCDACFCCPSARPILPVQFAVDPRLPLLGPVSWSSDMLPRSADPREIFHIPKRQLA